MSLGVKGPTILLVPDLPPHLGSSLGELRGTEKKLLMSPGLSLPDFRRQASSGSSVGR